MPKALIIRAGSVAVRLFANRSGDYLRHEIRWTDQYGRPRRRKRSRRAEALAEARRIAQALAQARPDLSLSDLASFRAALQNLYGTGKTLELATAEYAEARRILLNSLSAIGGEGRGDGPETFHVPSLPDLARHWLATQPETRNPQPATLAEILAEFLALKGRRCASAEYKRNVRQRLETFAGSIGAELPALTPARLQRWLDQLPVGPRTRENYLSDVTNLAAFAKTRNYLPDTWKVTEQVELAAAPDKEITTFSPEELSLLLSHVAPSALPAMLLGAFAGLRQSEILRLDWSHVDFTDAHIVVPGGKTGRRLVPLLPNLRAWLHPLKPLKALGPIVSLTANGVRSANTRAVARANRALESARQKPVLQWRQNALRHTFASCRLALVQNAAAVAEETGHSVSILKKHYRKLVTPAQAAAWFGIGPAARAANIVQLALPLREEGEWNKVSP